MFDCQMSYHRWPVCLDSGLRAVLGLLLQIGFSLRAFCKHGKLQYLKKGGQPNTDSKTPICKVDIRLDSDAQDTDISNIHDSGISFTIYLYLSSNVWSTVSNQHLSCTYTFRVKCFSFLLAFYSYCQPSYLWNEFIDCYVDKGIGLTTTSF